MVGNIVFEERGFPVELGSVSEIERAVATGRLRGDTLVRTGMEDGDPRTTPASHVRWLRPFLGLAEADTAAPAEQAPAPLPTQASTSPPADVPVDMARPSGSTFWEPPAKRRQPVRTSPTSTPTATSRISDKEQEGGRDVDRASAGATPSSRFVEPHGILARATMPLLRYATFTGRSSPREFWAFAILLLVALTIVVGAAGPTTFGLCMVAVVVPSLAVSVRRCHDQDRSGWFVLVSCVPYIGWLIFLVLMAVPGTPGRNRFGTNPMGAA